ncbi:MAG: GIDE domain-containing protein [Myxococcales bacterium]|nr:GIDE domain-containing protein [Myxococcales bacterium]
MGILLLLVGVAVLGFGLFQHTKGKRILSAPFKKTGELKSNPTTSDPKGAISTEGKVIAPAQQLLSPCTKQPCLAYEVKIERLWEKVETTEDGTKTVKGSDTLDTLKGGAVFGLDDGSGVFTIDVSKGADFDNFKDGFKKELNGRGWASQIQFGELNYDLPVLSDSEKYTIGFKATEKYVPVEGSLFVLGKLEGASIVKPGWRSLMTSSKGRDGLMGSITKKKKFSFIGGGITAVLSIPAMLFGPSIDTSGPSSSCESALTDTRVKCSDRVSSKSGETYTWTVTKGGEYQLTVFAPSSKKVAFDPELVIEDAKGEVLADTEGGVGGNAVAKLHVEPGTYKLTVKPGDDYMVKGGFGFDLEISGGPAADMAGAPVAKAEGNAAPVAVAGGELGEQVALLNELCPDTFCEGDYQYKFKKLDCVEATRCVLSFDAKDLKGKSFAAQVPVVGFKALDDEEASFVGAVSESLMKWESLPTNLKTVAMANPGKAPAKPAAKPAKK